MTTAKSPTWGICTSCGKERRLSKRGYLVPHNRQNKVTGQMVECEGGGHRPELDGDGEPVPAAWPPRVRSA